MTDLTNLRIFGCTSPINMNLTFYRLIGVAQQTFDQDPLSGQVAQNKLRRPMVEILSENCPRTTGTDPKKCVKSGLSAMKRRFTVVTRKCFWFWTYK